MKLHRLVPITVVAATIFAVGCGGDDDGGSSSDSELVAPLAAAIVEEEDGLTTDPAEAQCAASAIVSSIGEERLNELGMTADNVGEMEDYDFTDDEFASIFDGVFSCVDVNSALSESLVESGLTEEQASCMIGELGEDTLKAMATASASGNGEPTAEQTEELNASAVACGVG